MKICKGKQTLDGIFLSLLLSGELEEALIFHINST